MSELETKMLHILNEKRNKVKPAYIKKDITMFGITGVLESTGVMTSEEYNTCQDLANVIMYGGEPPLPYTELEYIESTGTQYISLPLVPTNHKLEIKFQCTVATNNGVIFGSENLTYHMTWFESKWYYACGSTEQNLSSTSCTDLQTVIFNNDNNKISFNGVEYGSTSGTSASTHTLSLLHRTYNSIGTSSKASAKIYYCKIINKATGSTVYDLIPVKRNEDNAVCLYDKVSYQFFFNNGTGVFIAGPEKEVDE